MIVGKLKLPEVRPVPGLCHVAICAKQAPMFKEASPLQSPPSMNQYNLGQGPPASSLPKTSGTIGHLAGRGAGRKRMQKEFPSAEQSQVRKLSGSSFGNSARFFHSDWRLRRF